jgi:hypothetical protein
VYVSVAVFFFFSGFWDWLVDARISTPSISESTSMVLSSALLSWSARTFFFRGAFDLGFVVAALGLATALGAAFAVAKTFAGRSKRSQEEITNTNLLDWGIILRL